MARVPAGIQLGRGVRPGVLRGLELLAAALLLGAAWAGASLWLARSELAASPGQGGSPASVSGAGGPAASETGRAREAAVLLLAGAMDAPDLAAAFAAIRDTAPPGLRVTGIETRSTGGGQVEAIVAAEGASAAEIAGFLEALGVHESVLATEVISETRETDGAAQVRITVQLDLAPRPPEGS